MSAVSSFNTQEVRVWDKPEKAASKAIDFPQTYVASPRTVVALASLDIKEGTGARVKAYESDVKPSGYTAHIDTWADTTLWTAGTNTLVLKPANLDFLSGEFSTEQDHPWDKPQGETSRRINFERPFVTPPKVLVFLKSFDIAHNSSTRVRVYASDIDATGFTIHIFTWADTVLYTAIASWVAYPEDRDYIHSGTVTTEEVRKWDNPIHNNQKDVSFEPTQFLKKPTVFVGLNWIDISTQAGLRVNAYADNISEKGMTWHIDSWADTKLWVGGLSYIAFH